MLSSIARTLSADFSSLLHLPNILKETHQLFERNKPVVTPRIITGFLAEKGEARLHIPKVFDPSLGVTLAKKIFNFPAVGAIEAVDRLRVFGINV